MTKTYSIRYFYSGIGYYMGSRLFTRHVAYQRSRKVEARSLLAAARKLRRGLNRRMASVSRFRLLAAWELNPDWGTTDRRPWNLIADHRGED